MGTAIDATFTLFKISFHHDVLFAATFFSCISIGLFVYLSVPQVNSECFVSVYSCISRIPKTFYPYLLTFFVYYLFDSFFRLINSIPNQTCGGVVSTHVHES